jgi:hypothetical protein
VGLDETLDLHVAVQLPNELLSDSALVQQLTKDPIVLAISGTLDEPKIQLASDRGLIKSIQGLITGDSAQQPSDESLSDAISGAAEAVGGILQGLRKNREARASEPDENRSSRPSLRERIRDRSLLRNRNNVPQEPDPPLTDPPQPVAPQPEPPQPDAPPPVDL